MAVGVLRVRKTFREHDGYYSIETLYVKNNIFDKFLNFLTHNLTRQYNLLVKSMDRINVIHVLCGVVYFSSDQYIK